MGDLVYDNKIKVKFKKGGSYAEREITNPAELLREIINKAFTPEAAQNWSKEINHVKHLKPEVRAKIAKNSDYKIDPKKDYMGTMIQPKTYGEYAMALLGAMSSMREGRAQFDKHSTGAKVKPYFEADTGANLFGMLASRIQLLQQNISQETPTNLEEGSPRNTYKNLKKYMSAFDEQVMYSENPEKNPDGKIPAPIAAQDRILLNIAYTQLSLDHFGRASGKVGENVYYNRAVTDHMLAAEEELDSNIEYLESVLASGRAPDKVAILGETFKEGDLFRYGNEIRRATKPFTMSQVFQNPNVLSQVSELSGGNYEAQKISEEDKKKISALLESAKQTRERFTNYQLGFDDSDILNSQPQVDEYGTPLTYRHWLLNINERLAAEGPAKADIPFGGFHKSQRPQTNSKSLEDPIYTGNRFNLEEREVALAKAKENLANGNPTPEDLQLLADEAYENQKVTSQVHGITNRDSTMSGKLAGQLAAEVAKKNDNSELNNSPLEVQRELLSNPALDRQFNLALYLRRMVLRGDQRFARKYAYYHHYRSKW